MTPAERQKVKWATLENETGTATLKQHAFIEIYDGNKALCNTTYMDDGNGRGNRMPWVRINSESISPTACKKCFKTIKMTDQQKKYKEIAEAFIKFWWENNLPLAGLFEAWLLTEEGKRLTAEEPEPGVIQGIWAVPEEKHRAAMEAAGLRNKSEESCIILLQKVVAQLDRMEGNMKLTKEL